MRASRNSSPSWTSIHNSIESISKSFNNNIDSIVDYVPNGIASKNSVLGTKISRISIRQLVVAANSMKCYTVIGRIPDFDNIYYVNVLGWFKTY